MQFTDKIMYCCETVLFVNLDQRTLHCREPGQVDTSSYYRQSMNVGVYFLINLPVQLIIVTIRTSLLFIVSS